MKILIMMTGGTISTTVNENGHLAANVKQTVSLLAKKVYESGITDVEFEYSHPLDILSENMTFPRLNRLLEAFTELDPEEYSAIIVAHGTDTLAYTSSLLSLSLAGWWNKPIFLVSSDYTLTDSRANGHDNFRAAVELAIKGFGAGVYVPYRNSDGVTYLHHGAHLRQCANFTGDFFSADMCPVSEAKPYKIQADYSIIGSLRRLDDCVMRIDPYVGIDYSAYNPSENIRAVLHGSYHSATACVERSNAAEGYTRRSALYLLDLCKKRGIDVFLSPLPEHMRASSGTYSTTAELVKRGMKPIFSMTNECAYMKLALAYSLGFEEDEVALFMEKEIVGEKVDW